MDVSFASRRPAAGGLPHFQLPPPNPTVDVQVPRVTGSEGLSPLTNSSNSSGSQSSQAGIAPYHPTGSWQLPGNSSYTYSSMSPGHTGLVQPSYGRPVYSPPGAASSRFRPRQPGTPGEGLAAPPYDSVSPPFPLPVPGAGSSHHSMVPHSAPDHHQALPNTSLGAQAAGSQPPAAPAAVAAEAYPGPPHSSSYYPPSSTPQQPSYPSFASTQPSATQGSPTTTTSASRSIPAVTAQPHPVMQAPQPYHHNRYHYGSLPPAMGGAVLSNMANPGGQMTLVGGSLGGHMPHSYPQHHMGPPQHHMYHHGQQPQQDRPFKCDVCTQSFNRNHDLKRHKRIHLAVKPFPCNHCDKSFSRKDALKRHRLVKGCGGGKGSPTNGNDASPQDDIKSDPEPATNGVPK